MLKKLIFACATAMLLLSVALGSALAESVQERAERCLTEAKGARFVIEFTEFAEQELGDAALSKAFATEAIIRCDEHRSDMERWWGATVAACDGEIATAVEVFVRSQGSNLDVQNPQMLDAGMQYALSETKACRYRFYRSQIRSIRADWGV